MGLNASVEGDGKVIARSTETRILHDEEGNIVIEQHGNQEREWYALTLDAVTTAMDDFDDYIIADDPYWDLITTRQSCSLTNAAIGAYVLRRISEYVIWDYDYTS